VHVYAGCEQREAMTTVEVLKERPDLVDFTVDIMTLLVTACATALGGGGGTGGGAGAGAG